MSLEVEARERFRFYKLNSSQKKILLEKIGKLLENRKEVLLAFVYGSFLKNMPFRDIDIAVYLDQKIDHLNYKFKLDKTFSDGIKLPVDTRVLNRAPPWFTAKVIEEGKKLTERVPLLTEKLYLKALDEKAKIIYTKETV